jgi:predicted lipoprotein
VKKPVIVAAAATLAGALALGACSSGESSAPAADRQAVVTAMIDEVVTPTMITAGESIAAADAAAAAYCTSPSPDTLDAAVTAVDVALGDWERLDVVDMGPMMLMRTDSHVGYAVDPAKVEELIVEGPPQDVATVNDRTASSTRGLTTAEYLLLADPEPGTDPVRCAYLTAVTADAAAEMAAAITESVDGTATATAYHELLAGRGAEPIDPGETIDVVVNMAITVLEKDAGLLGDPGEQTEASVRRATAAHLATVGALWGDGSSGLSVLVDDDLGTRVTAELAAAEAAVDGPVVSASDAQDAVDEVRATLGTEVVSALDVTVGFSDNDGDS